MNDPDTETQSSGWLGKPDDVAFSIAHIHAWVRARVHTHTRTHTCMQAFIRTHTYTCKNTHTQRHTHAPSSRFMPRFVPRQNWWWWAKETGKKPEQAISWARFMATGNRLIHFMFCRIEKLCNILILNSYHWIYCFFSRNDLCCFLIFTVSTEARCYRLRTK